jgi:hypothetical protein
MVEGEIHVGAPDVTSARNEQFGYPSPYDNHIVSILTERA